jgi:methionine aminotransferase
MCLRSIRRASSASPSTCATPRATSGWQRSTRPGASSFTQQLDGSRFELLACRGTYFQLARYRAIADLPDREFAQWLTREAGVAVIPVSVFYHDGRDDHVVRFCFAKQEATLAAAGEKLRRL